MKRKISEEEIQKMLAENKLTNSENNLHRVPYKSEISFLNKVRTGSYRDISFIEFRELKENVGKSASELKLWEYYTVSAVSLATRAAIDAGLSLDEAFDIADVMLQRLETAKSVDEMHHIIIISATLLAYLVHQSKLQKGHYLIEQAKKYISRNIFSKIYLEDIAAYVKVHPNYLSHFFSTHEDITLHDYIMREKMQIACNLLRYSDHSIAEISQYISIPSQSNFTAVFKKWIGTTPQKYRNDNLYSEYRK